MNRSISLMPRVQRIFTSSTAGTDRPHATRWLSPHFCREGNASPDADLTPHFHGRYLVKGTFHLELALWRISPTQEGQLEIVYQDILPFLL